MQKKIAIINSVCGTGSTGRIVNDLAIFLRTKGFDARIFFGRNLNRFKAPYAKCFSNYLDSLVHCLKARFFDKSGFSSNHVTYKLIKELNQFDPDLMILNNLHGYYLNINILFNWIKNKNKKIILVCHDCWNFTGHCAHFDYLNCDRWEKQCFSCPAKASYPKSILIDRSRKNYLIKKQLYSNIENMIVVSPSNWLSNIIHRSFLGSYETVVINNGIDTNLFKKTEGNFRIRFGVGDKKIILCVAYIFGKRKGIDDILALSKILDDNEIIVLVGHLKGHIKINNNKILHIKRTDDLKQLVELYSISDVMFNPTYEDNYPTTNLEALSCGTPVVCYKTGGAFEMLDKKYVVEKGDYKTAYLLMKRIFNEGIKNLSHPVFSKEKMYDQYLELIERLLK
ncbi:MAG: glycosyltransferase [Candidatus Enteromonas sp.]|nr:glycosyltransferase [Candidatus Enteromonas sp.]